MMNVLPTLGLRERRLALIALALILCWGAVSWVLEPQWERVRDLRVQVASRTERFEALSRLSQRSASVERAYQQVSGLVSGGGEGAQESFLSDLETLCRDSGLQQPKLKPRPVKQDAQVTRFEVELDLEGPQASLLAFLDALFRMPRLIAIERLRLASVPTSAQVLRANLVVQHLVLQNL